MGINIHISQHWNPRLMLLILLLSHIGIRVSNAQLSETFYDSTCPIAPSIIRLGVFSAISFDPRMGASLLRLHFSDCFVNGCDASVLLDDTAAFIGEKAAAPNRNSLRGFEVIDNIKAQLEAACPGVVSCADILTIAARDSVVLLGGASWAVRLGRRDSTNASFIDANTQIPSHELDLDALISAFAAKGFTSRELVALSGAHTIGMARCITVRSRIYNETTIDPTFADAMRSICPYSNGGENRLLPLDATTANSFDTAYFDNLIRERGMLHSDQQLVVNGGSTGVIVQEYSRSPPSTFFNDFAAAMVKMSELSPLSDAPSQIRRNCRRAN